MVDGVGAFKKVRALRNEKRADVVALIVDDASGCGLSTRVAADADEAFVVVHHACAALTYSLAHEIGHIIGARHDKALDQNTSPFPYGHGYVNGAKWRDIMSYKASCNGCPRLPFWSNPTIKIKGERAGTIETDNARVILEQAERVSKFRYDAAAMIGSVPCDYSRRKHFFLARVGGWSRGGGAARSERSTLANGMQVVVIPDHRVPVVTHMVWYRAGAADDPWGTSGIAHFLEHLMFKSTGKIKSGEFTRIITRLGGRDNAVTTHDTTSYYQRVAKEHLRTVMGAGSGPHGESASWWRRRCAPNATSYRRSGAPAWRPTRSRC